MRVLLIVDPQNDFVDPRGSLFVKGAEEAIDKICEYLKTNDDIDRIIVTQDSHQYYHIGHSEFWKGDPQPGTVIDLELNEYEPKNENMNMARIKSINNNRYITIWPHHCIEGTWGCNFPERLSKALNEWGVRNTKDFEIYRKGRIPHCESFSLFIEQGINFTGTTNLKICGFCKDICVYETLKSIVETAMLPKDSTIDIIEECTVAYGPDDEILKSKYDELFTLQRGYF